MIDLQIFDTATEAYTPRRILRKTCVDLLSMRHMIRLEKSARENYPDLISWITNEEELMQFAGPAFTFPLTTEQLYTSLSDKNRIAFTILRVDTNRSIGHAEIYLLKNSVRLGRIIIGDLSQRGKGLGQQIMHLLLEYTFYYLDRTRAELNVFDWNIAAIKCYEKVGFVKDYDKRLERKVNGKTWNAFNMWIDKKIYEEARSIT